MLRRPPADSGDGGSGDLVVLPFRDAGSSTTLYRYTALYEKWFGPDTFGPQPLPANRAPLPEPVPGASVLLLFPSLFGRKTLFF